MSLYVLDPLCQKQNKIIDFVRYALAWSRPIDRVLLNTLNLSLRVQQTSKLHMRIQEIPMHPNVKKNAKWAQGLSNITQDAHHSRAEVLLNLFSPLWVRHIKIRIVFKFLSPHL